jgi:RNA polymerase sigma factor (sigma-70 family)
MNNQSAIPTGLLSVPQAIAALKSQPTIDELLKHMITYVKRSFPSLAAEAEDLAISAIESVYTNLATHSDEMDLENLEAYVRRAVINKAIDRQRAEKRVKTVRAAELLGSQLEHSPSPELQILDEISLFQSLEMLTEQEVQVIRSILDGMEIKEIATAEKLTVQRIYQIRHNAISRLKQLLNIA